MKEIPDRLVVGLLVLAILVSLTGTLLSLNKMGELKLGITGMVTNTTTGVANLTIYGRTEITNRNISIHWGTGYVNSSFTNCTLNTNGSQPVGCINFTNITRGFVLENTGNYNLSVNYSADKNAESFIGGSNPAPRLRIKAMANSAAGQTDDSVVDTTASCQGWWNISSYIDVTTGGDWLCGNRSSNYSLEPGNDRDAGVVDIDVMIPANAPAGDKKLTFTFNAWSSG